MYPSVGLDDACLLAFPIPFQVCKYFIAPQLLHRVLSVFIDKTKRHTMPLPQPELPEPAHPTVDSMLSRKFGKEVANYFSGKF
jgi:hypothetical protein